MKQSNSEASPHPEEFPLHSLESRAAARAVLEAKERSVRRFHVVHCIPRPFQDNSIPNIGEWRPWGHGSLCRIVYVPVGIDEKTREHLLGRP